MYSVVILICVSIHLAIYIAILLHTIYLDPLQAVHEKTIRGECEDGNWVTLRMTLEAMMEQDW